MFGVYGADVGTWSVIGGGEIFGDCDVDERGRDLAAVGAVLDGLGLVTYLCGLGRGVAFALVH